MEGVAKYSEHGLVEVAELDPQILKDVLIHYGADFEPKPEITKLKQKTNKYRRSGMNAVWRERYMDNFNRWTVSFADKYESTGRKLPRLGKSGNRTSGMRHFLGHLTAFAAGQVEFDTLKDRLQARMQNGWLYAQGRPKKEFDFLPDDKKFPGLIPPYFSESAWNVIKSRELSTGVPEVQLPSRLQSN